MNNKIKFIMSMVLSGLFFVTVFSLFTRSQNAEETLNTVHIWSGMLLLIGVNAHLLQNTRWMRAVFSKPAKELKPAFRRLRRTNLLLLIFEITCGLTGIIRLIEGLPPAVLEQLSKIHEVSGWLTILLIGMHMLLHWNWLVSTIRQVFGRPEASTADRAGSSVSRLQG